MKRSSPSSGKLNCSCWICVKHEGRSPAVKPIICVKRPAMKWWLVTLPHEAFNMLHDEEGMSSAFRVGFCTQKEVAREIVEKIRESRPDWYLDFYEDDFDFLGPGLKATYVLVEEQQLSPDTKKARRKEKKKEFR